MKEETTKEKTPIISVVIPCYNHGLFVEDNVISVIEQTFDDFEIIIVNDGSTDSKTLVVLNKLKKKYPEIKIIHQKNGHLSNARNTGIKESRGDFFLPLDSDDFIEPEMLKKCYEEIKKDPKIGFVYTYVRFFGDINFVWKNQEYNFYDLLFFNHPTVCALVRKSAWEDVGGYDENMKDGYEDWDFWISLGEKGWFGKLLKEPLFRYRKHGKSMIDDARAKHDKIYEYIKKKHAPLYTIESLKNLRLIWKSSSLFEGIMKFTSKKLRIIKLKFALAGILDKNEWKNYPLRTMGRCIPIRIKKIINNIFKTKLFDESYFDRHI